MNVLDGSGLRDQGPGRIDTHNRGAAIGKGPSNDTFSTSKVENVRPASCCERSDSSMSRENSCIADPSRTKRVYHSAMLSHVSSTESRAYRSTTAHAGGMGTQPPAHADRRRAGAFGLAAADYHRYRPRYPHRLISGLVDHNRMNVLDVGAGTGIAAAQLQDAGADVLAVEPDPRMAHVAIEHGLRVEEARFEDWDPGERSFDLVVFAQSFHWVQPEPALGKIASILRPGGRLALLSNRITPISPTQADLDDAYAPHLDKSQRPAIDAAHDDHLMAMLRSYGYALERCHVTEPLHYSTDAWVNMVFTYSNVLTLNAQARSKLRVRLEQCIGASGVDAENQAVAITATPAHDSDATP